MGLVRKKIRLISRVSRNTNSEAVEGKILPNTIMIINCISQIGLLCLALFGYFYTVVPVYTKALLEEQIAEKELQLKKMSLTSRKLEEDVQKKNLELSNLKKMASEAEYKLIDTQKKLQKAGSKIKEKDMELSSKDEQISITAQSSAKYHNLARDSAIKIFRFDLDNCSRFIFLHKRPYYDRDDRSERGNREDYKIESAKRYLEDENESYEKSINLTSECVVKAASKKEFVNSIDEKELELIDKQIKTSNSYFRTQTKPLIDELVKKKNETYLNLEKDGAMDYRTYLRMELETINIEKEYKIKASAIYTEEIKKILGLVI